MEKVKINNKNIRLFGLIWSVIFCLYSIYPLFYTNNIKIWSLIISFLFFIISIFKPKFLKIFYIIWIKFGNLMGFIISGIIMFILYYFLFTPISILLTIAGKDLLNKKIDRNAKTYWLSRKVQANSMKKQF